MSNSRKYRRGIEQKASGGGPAPSRALTVKDFEALSVEWAETTDEVLVALIADEAEREPEGILRRQLEPIGSR
ncbi:MAG: hypothetical protein M0T80_09345 [Actinomycetota bacterium]|nr:hypothetical protein [Actinomycetota bacterium]